MKETKYNQERRRAGKERSWAGDPHEDWGALQLCQATERPTVPADAQHGVSAIRKLKFALKNFN